MADCKCVTEAHNHPNNKCDQIATANDGYCQSCHDEAAKEWFASKIHVLTPQDPLLKT